MRSFWKLAALHLAGAAVLSAQPFTLEQALSAPFPTELVSARAGAKLAWVFNERGARNLWVAEAPAWRGRRLTDYQADDGQDILTPRWSADARHIVFVRGEAANARGEYPNPVSDPRGVKQTVFVAPAAGGAPREIGEGHGAVAGRDRVYFLRSSQIWSAPLEGTEKPSQLLHARGRSESLELSPDGGKLAFVSARGDHSFIGVYDLTAGTLRYLDASTDRDVEPAWSPDSRSVAFIRLSSARLSWGPHRTADPWTLRIADATGGPGREVWHAAAGPGSAFRGLGSDQNLFWAEGGRLVFPWERDGWLHLYAVPSQGGEAALLTPGEFEVEHVAMTPAGKELVFSSNQGDIDRRHIWRVPAAGGAVTAVTSGAGIECQPAVAADGTVAYLRSDARLPLRPATRQGDLAPHTMPADFPGAALVEPQPVIFPSTDGLALHGQLFLPKTAPGNAPRPAVIFFHGGSRRQMLLGWHYMYYYSNSYALNQYFASRGYVVLSVNYRSGIGYGLDFREALHYGATGASEFQDVLAAGLYLRGRADVDAARIGLWGGSYGGFLTAMGLARASGQFAAGVDLHGVHDWSKELSGLDADAARVAFESSPMATVQDWRSPVLLIHGDDDRNVDFSQTVMLASALRRQKVEFEELIFPDEIHDFLVNAHWLQAYHAASDFFDRKLKNRAPRKW